MWIHDPPGAPVATEGGGFKIKGGQMRFFRASTPFPVPGVGDVIQLEVEPAAGRDERVRARMNSDRSVVVRVEHCIEVKESGIVHNLHVHTEPESRRG